MRLYTFDVRGRVARRPLLGAEADGSLVDLAAAYAAYVEQGEGLGSSAGTSAGLPLRGLPTLLAAGGDGLAVAEEALRFARAAGASVAGHLRYGFDEVRLRPPLLRPGKILCAGVNYTGHLQENPAAGRPDEPFFFAKLPSGVVGPADAIVKPALTDQLDYEVELAVVIGRLLRHAPPERALEHVAGYTIMNDVSARDIQFRNNQVTLGKNFDTFAPMGPCLVTADEIGDPGRLRLRTWVNGEARQDETTADMIFSVAELLSRLSVVMTLEPGDVVSTGTPAGVGAFRTPPVFLQPGDVVRLEIDGIGRLENQVVGPAA
jgi:2-keto-4-pentenoate hydratase/2-oxohepta-3-ene-1,7-dioic acid hydratase in catechol pathway